MGEMGNLESAEMRLRVKEPCGLTFAQLCKLSDENVLAHVQAGHDDALAVLFDRYHRLVLSVALKILRDLGEAEDVTQAVFLEIYKVAAQFDPARGTTKVWLLQYAYHRSINRREYLKKRKFYEAEDLEQVERSLLERSQPAVIAGNTLTFQELRRLVRQALETLNQRQKRTIQLAYFEGMSLNDIAEHTGESLGNVRHNYYRGLQRLRSVVRDGHSNEAKEESAELAHQGNVNVKA
jgi:RNA polymerase sigma-70 factor (ECF subfamily)